MNDEKKDGPACSIQSRPVSTEGILNSFKRVDVAGASQLIESMNPLVLIIDAEWCGDCRNQMRNLPQFESALQSLGIDLYIFTAEGPFYDRFVSPGHQEFAMRLYGTPLDETIFGERSGKPDTTSVIGKRGREAYPAIFFISEGRVRYWSIEDVSPKQLEGAFNKIREKLG